jgi:MoaA/NifB/PqqE/SkfB family radical SAM enzyme
MYSLDTIRKCHVELTTRCNAACPQCPRNYPDGSQNENLPDAELDLQYFKDRVPARLFKNVNTWQFCGNYGDPAVARDASEIFKYIRSKNGNTSLVVHTNGAPRSPAWWWGIAQCGVECVFGIDGLEDTNRLYRRRTEWRKVMGNASSFISAGGRATWQFIVFEHNQHQVDSCVELARALGFHRFVIRKTNRFLSPKGGLVQKLEIPASDIGQNTYALRPPTDKRYVNSGLPKNSVAEGYNARLRGASVTCKAQRDSELYIAATAHVFPCCYLGHMHLKGQAVDAHELVRMLSDRGFSIDNINSRMRSIAEILSSAIFQDIIPDSWKTDAPERVLTTCRRVCGLERQAFDDTVTKEAIVLN